MTPMYADWKQKILLGLWLTALFGNSVAVAADSPFVGSQSCNSVSCHGRPEPRRIAGGLGSASLQEFSLYQTHDPHANAAKTLVNSEFQLILNKLSERKEGPSRAEVNRQCAACHDPEGIAATKQTVEGLLPPEPGHSISSRGISCESCHGGGKNWLASHYERDVSRSSLVASGMTDTKDLHVRGELCASCHVGSSEQNVSHEMLAAGHPPLRFELAAYHRQLTSHDSSGKQSHWNDARERISTKDFEVKLWEAGQFASAKAALTLLESRAHQAALAAKENNSLGGSWPEFAEYDCFGCHQKLRPASENRRAAISLPAWGEWNFAFASSAAAQSDLRALRAEMKKSFIVLPSTVEPLAAKARQSFSLSLPGEKANSHQLLQLLEQPSERTNSWDGLCQRYLAQRVIEKSIGDEFQKRELAGEMSDLLREAFDQQRDELDRDLAAIAHQLSFSDPKREWPRVLTTPQGIEKVESDLSAAAGKLRKLQGYLEPKR